MAEPEGSIGAKTVVRGTLKGTGAVKVSGQLEGRVEIDDAFEVNSEAQVDAEVHAKSVRLEGCCRGSVHAQRLILGAGGFMAGEAVVEEFQVEEGARWGGRLRMKLDLPSGVESA
ncbi:MAG: polymer-forming cytoskeletal protein [Myxococcota bacterium]